MTQINDIAFRLAQKIDDTNPLFTREELIRNVTEALKQRNYPPSEANRAAILQVAEYEHQNALYVVDTKLSTTNVIFVRVPGEENLRPIFLNDLIRTHLDTEAA